MEPATPTTFAEALRAERKRLELTQAELARRVETTQQNVGHWEAGRALPRAELFERLVEVFGKGSPIATLRPRGVLNTPDAAVRERPLTFGYTTEALALKAEEAREVRRPVHPSAAHSLRAVFASFLADDLKRYAEESVQLGASHYYPYYHSSRLCVQMITAALPRASLVPVRLGLYQLLLYRQIGQQYVTDGRRYMLIVIDPQLAVLNSSLAGRILLETNLFGLEIRFCEGPEAAARTVEAIESGADKPPTELDDSDELGHPL